MSTEAQKPAEPASQEYDNFTKGLKRLLSVPKSEIDKREDEWRKEQENKAKRGPKKAA